MRGVAQTVIVPVRSASAAGLTDGSMPISGTENTSRSRGMKLVVTVLQAITTTSHSSSSISWRTIGSEKP